MATPPLCRPEVVVDSAEDGQALIVISTCPYCICSLGRAYSSDRYANIIPASSVLDVHACIET